jgi:hypothetical protein
MQNPIFLYTVHDFQTTKQGTSKADLPLGYQSKFKKK